ncbi:MAG: hypothetical protein FJ276_06330 [Planctomycetes bacterium]|nr:hypothetical protein [Planctomycetota bacterium]
MEVWAREPKRMMRRRERGPWSDRGSLAQGAVAVGRTELNSRDQFAWGAEGGTLAARFGEQEPGTFPSTFGRECHEMMAKESLRMAGIPVLASSGDSIARAWENSLIELYERGCDISTEYDRAGDPPSKDATMLITVEDPLSEPMIHRDMPGGLEDLQEYVMEVCEGIKDHWVRDRRDTADTRWEYTYHERLFRYTVPSLPDSVDQIEGMCRQLARTGFTRRAQAVTWKVWEDRDCYDPACLQSVWCRITQDKGQACLNMNVRFRSNDAYRAAFMNIFALVQLQSRIAARISQLSGQEIKLGRYCHLADSYHIYGSNMAEFRSRFLGAMKTRDFAGRTMRYLDVKDMMEEARPGILDKARGADMSDR